MHRLLDTLRHHRHVFIIFTLLILVVTFPTIVYVFNSDVFWLPTTHSDIFIDFWVAWYGEQFLTGQADRHYTNVVFYPEGLALSQHPFVITNIVAVSIFNLFLPLSNAFNLAWLLIIFTCALSAYPYLLWLFKDKWIALLGAVVFGFSPHVVAEPHHPAITFVATIPLALYCFHRGVKEQRTVLIVLSGLLAGFTAYLILYTFVILLTMLGLYVCALAISRWRDRRYWQYVALLALVVAVSSFWAVYPLLSDRESTAALIGWYTVPQLKTDAISSFVNHRHPLFGPLLGDILQTPGGANLSSTSFLGYLPLLLIGYGLYKSKTRRNMLPWAVLCGIFLVLRLGPFLNINGVAFPNILLPKFYLDQIPPGMFKAFIAPDQFMAGAILPLAVLTCYGLVALQRRMPSANKPIFILALVIIVAFEYYQPVSEQVIPQEQFDFLDWLRSEEDQRDIRLINLPMGRGRSKKYNLYQALSGYPHAEGAISRTPDSAFNYIRANLLLNTWYQSEPINCELADRDAYLKSLAQLEEDGFSHVVYHLGSRDWDSIKRGFHEVAPAYADEHVSIYRLHDFRDGCTEEYSALYAFNRAYADALHQRSILDERPGLVLVFAPAIRESESFLRNFRHFGEAGRTIAAITTDGQANVEIHRSDYTDTFSISDLEQYAALWLVNSPQTFDAEQTPAFRDWFAKRFHFCRRAHEDAGAVVDLYLNVDIPCSAMDDSSALEVEYDGGVRLHNASFAFKDDLLHLYLAWTKATTNHYGFSLQFFDEDGEKALQHDNVIYRLLSQHEINISSLRPGDYSIQLIVYDFETGTSQGGTISDSGKRFSRELEIGRLVVTP